MSMNKISGLVSFCMKVIQGLDVTETNYEGFFIKKMINIIYFSMKQTLMIIQLQSVGLSLIMIKFVCVVMVKSL